jgi:hypothetical protein
MPPKKNKQQDMSDRVDPPQGYNGNQYDFMEEYRRSDNFTCLDLLLDWCDDKFTEKITPRFAQ